MEVEGVGKKAYPMFLCIGSLGRLRELRMAEEG